MKEISYKNEYDLDLTNDITSRKEFYMFKKEVDDINLIIKKDKKYNIIPKFLINENVPDSNYLELYSYQLFVKNFVSPNTSYSRLLLKWSTGLGKTSGALSVALNFIRFYQKDYELSEKIGSVYIIGFTQNIFKDELLKYPEFGFISRSELEKLNKLKKQSYIGNPVDIEKLKKFNIYLKKRLYNRKGNGFFKFIGYRELSNHLFIKKNENIILPSLSEEELKEHIKSGDIVLNEKLISEFNNSLIICDEIHNVYNTLEKNDWGVALQTILNYHDSCRALFLSATPLNNSPTEIIDLLNLLLPRKYYPELKKKDFFDDEKILTNKEKIIANFLKGRISFIRNRNTKFIATKKFVGESIPGIDYLKFIRCPMSKFHYNTYKDVISSNDQSLPMNTKFITDFAIPDPFFKSPFKNLGLYKTKEIKDKLENASQSWKSKIGIAYNGKTEIISGDILKKENIDVISSKYYHMITALQDNITNKKGKVFIYHTVIHMSGTIFIQEILLRNNIIGEFDNSSDTTLCSICGKMRKDHNDSQLNLVQIGGIEKLDTNELYTKNFVSEFSVYKNKIKLMTYYKYEDSFISFPSDINENLETSQIYNLLEYIKELPIVIIVSNNNKYLDIFYKYYDFHVSLNDLNDSSELNHSSELNDSSDSKNLIFYNSKFFPLLNSDEKMSKYITKYITDTANKIGGVSLNDNHFYQPVRFVIVHSNIENRIINQSIEKFNHINNIDGSKFMILIGSNIMKEAKSINSVRNIFVMSRPDNISTLIQIIGRAIRLGSHKLLPINERNVDIKIFTSSIDKKNTISYEEFKYKNKVDTFKVIQKLEKLMHENAIDGYFNYNKIWEKGDEFSLDILPYSIENEKHQKFKPSELNLSTFNVYYAKFEVNYINYIIKRLFIEISPVWKYNDLLEAVKKPPFEIEINSSIISQELFNIALNNIIHNESLNYTEPNMIELNNTIIDNNLLDKIQNPDDKIIINDLENELKYVIMHIGDIYTMIPIHNGEPIIETESIFRKIIYKSTPDIDILEYLKYSSNYGYEDKKEKFIKKWKLVEIVNLQQSLSDFGIKFHIQFIEEVIEYVFRMWVDPKQNKIKNHDFYLKMLYFYDIQKLILWAYTIDGDLKERYKKYISPVTIKLINSKENIENISESGQINLLISTLNKSNKEWISSGMIKDFEDKLHESEKLFNGIYKKSTVFKKVRADFLPVGHFMNNLPKLYNLEDKWTEEVSYIHVKTIKENPIIVGYDERSKTGIAVKFKIRNSNQNIKNHKDARLIEKGSVCNTKSKTYLFNILKKLDIKIKQTVSTEEICEKIRNKLIYLELQERVKQSGIRYFYYVYENN